jgi:16S rRNA processing protein RimM
MLLVGRIGRAHGLRGEVVVQLLTTEADRRLAPGAVLTTATGVELTVAAARPHQDRWLVAFEGVADRNGAEALRGAELLAPAIDDDPDALWVHDLVGAAVVDIAGAPCGTVAAVVANPADDLLELDDGALVPVRFVVGWDDPAADERRLVIDPPEGLFDL